MRNLNKFSSPIAHARGVTLVELMITIAVLSVLTAIAIPAYTGYLREGHYATMRSDINSLRIPIEDYRLENPSYAGATANAQIAALLADINAGRYTFAASVSTNSYGISGLFSSSIWIRCENRLNRCCDADTGGGASVTDCSFP